MSVLRTYDMGGNLLAQGTSVVPAGGLCWIGGDQYIVAASLRWNQISWDGFTGSSLKQTVLGNDVRANSVEMPRRQTFSDTGDANWEPDGDRLYFLVRTLDGADRHLGLQAWSLSEKTMLWQVIYQSQISNLGFGGITTNGLQWYTGYQLATLADHMDLTNIVDKSVTQLKTFSPANMPQDMCHDGLNLWTIENGVVRQRSVESDDNPQILSSFTPAGGTPVGITTDGLNLLISAAT